MNALASIWLRSFKIVTLTALNVMQVSQHRYGVAFITGGLLSWVWWSNTRTAARSDVRYAQLAYAIGAGCGTVFGMWLGGLWR
jgi:hypothetical protein